MNKSVKGIAIAAGAMVLAGIVLAGIGFIAGGKQPVYFDKTGIHVGSEDSANGKAEQLSETLDAFDSISTDLDYYNVELVASDKYAIEAKYNPKYGKLNYKIENGTLKVDDGRNSKFNIQIDLGALKYNSKNDNQTVKIYYPKDAELKDLTIKGAASSLSFEKLKLEKAEFDLDFGELDLTDLTAKTIKVSIDSGDCTMKEITADRLDVTNDLGQTTLDGGTVKTLIISADSGDVSVTGVTTDSGNLQLDLGKLTVKEINSKGLTLEAGSGDIDVQGVLQGVTDIQCDLGSVTVNPSGTKDQFRYELETDLGTVSVDEQESSGSISDSNASAKNSLKIQADMGDISVDFN